MYFFISSSFPSLSPYSSLLLIRLSFFSPSCRLIHHTLNSGDRKDSLQRKQDYTRTVKEIRIIINILMQYFACIWSYICLRLHIPLRLYGLGD
jgi:hypothetical protein